MSGIAGLYHLDGRPAAHSALQRMTDAMAHRGPDGLGHWVQGPVALGHRMLHTTPESLQEVQPMLDEHTGVCLVFDGRIDNREELRAKLEARGVIVRTNTDAELTIGAYNCWGEDCPQQLDGDFAFALWDARRARLFCARDPLGVKPLYYCRDGQTFVFASEMQPLFAGSAAVKRPNLMLMAVYLSGRFDEREETLYEGVRRLASAHSLTLERGKIVMRKYWDPDPEQSIRYRSDEEYGEHFLHLFRNAVRVRLRSHNPVGVFLSGGLDSGSIVSAAGLLQQEGVVPEKHVEAFSVVFEKFPCDERSYIGEVTQRWGIPENPTVYEDNLRYVALDQLGQYPDMLYAPTSMMWVPGLIDMRRRGISVVIDGIGGDELFGPGLAYLSDLAQEAKLRECLRQLRLNADAYSLAVASLALEYCVRPLLPHGLKARLRSLIQARRAAAWPRVLSAEFARRIYTDRGPGTRQPFRRYLRYAQNEIYQSLLAGWNATVAKEINELLVARFSVESRRPFLDRSLVEFVLAIPQQQRQWNGLSKVVLRKAMQGVLPEAVRRRTDKTGFESAVDFELRQRQVEEVEHLLQTSVLAAWKVVDLDRLLRLFASYRTSGRGDYKTTIESVLALEVWCRQAGA